MVLRVHPSNFRQEGFTEAPDAAELADLAHAHGAIVIDDLGSGALLPTEAFGLAHEPMPSERLAAGADLVTFSGDKLVGGPQAGLIVGRGDLVARIRRDPLARAMRPDKVTLAAVAATLALYRAGRAVEEIPVWRMIAAPRDAIRERAEADRRPGVGDRVGGRRHRGDRRRRVAARARCSRPSASRSAVDRPNGTLAALRQGTPVGDRPDRRRAGRPRPSDGRSGARRRPRDGRSAPRSAEP